MNVAARDTLARPAVLVVAFWLALSLTRRRCGPSRRTGRSPNG